MMLRALVVVAVVTGLMGCAQRAEDNRTVRAEPSSSSVARPDVHQGSLSAGERSLATAMAKREQRKVVGTFIGATAFVTHGTPFDRGSACDVDKRVVLNIRLVWKADANFTHSHLSNSPPDGPRKELLMTVDTATHQVCETGARYRNVGAGAHESLLYGQWPNRAEG